jgi:Uma2 family endonuclease
MSTAPAAPKVWTAEMLERLPDDGWRRELVRGELVEMSPPNARHGRVVIRLGSRLETYADKHDLGEVYSEVGWIFEHDPDTILGPDLSFVRKSRLKEVNEEGFARTYPDLAVEVLSPSNTAAEMVGKLEIYFRCGVSSVWIVEPKRQIAEIHRKGEPVRRLGLDDALEDPELLPGFSLPLRDLFRRSQSRES